MHRAGTCIYVWEAAVQFAVLLSWLGSSSPPGHLDSGPGVPPALRHGGLLLQVFEYYHLVQCRHFVTMSVRDHSNLTLVVIN